MSMAGSAQVRGVEGFAITTRKCPSSKKQQAGTWHAACGMLSSMGLATAVQHQRSRERKYESNIHWVLQAGHVIKWTKTMSSYMGREQAKRWP